MVLILVLWYLGQAVEIPLLSQFLVQPGLHGLLFTGLLRCLASPEFAHSLLAVVLGTHELFAGPLLDDVGSAHSLHLLYAGLFIEPPLALEHHGLLQGCQPRLLFGDQLLQLGPKHKVFLG